MRFSYSRKNVSVGSILILSAAQESVKSRMVTHPLPPGFPDLQILKDLETPHLDLHILRELAPNQQSHKAEGTPRRAGSNGRRKFTHSQNSKSAQACQVRDLLLW